MNIIRTAMSSASRSLDHPLFSTSFKNKMHYIQLALVTTVIILTGVRIALKPSFLPVTRSDTMAIVMGVKTIVVITYQLLTTHMSSLKRFRSTKAYLILNSLEVVFWLAVMVLTGMGMSRYCQGSYCGISVVILLLALVIMTFSFWTAVVSKKLRREEKYAVGSSLPTYQSQMEDSPTKPAAAYTTYQV
ncbi:hypothetical protein D6C91_04709 [Aureobasidium pullulans]|uniref:MARVEL domain-containing protein n=1 Tax=Aureobasidium pullulans TaxID=5580 RepID=A0A4S9T7X2_AURPU|nr:hypothetical protein D6C91_04709 [Aureobasidium pullulans]